MIENYVDFKAIKEVVSIETVLETLYDLKLRKVNALTFRGGCPLPTHPFGITDDSFSVNREKQVWICHNSKCQKSRKGRKGGDVIELVAVLENSTLREAGVKLGNEFLSANESARTDVLSNQPVRNKTEQTDYDLYYQPLVDWIEERMSLNLTSFEKTAYISVLGRIEEIACAEKR
jgi:hypothetical protein